MSNGMNFMSMEFKPVAEWKDGRGIEVYLYDSPIHSQMREEEIIFRVTRIASICRGEKQVLNPYKLFDQLLTESNGKPSSALEFIPVIRRARLTNLRGV